MFRRIRKKFFLVFLLFASFLLTIYFDRSPSQAIDGNIPTIVENVEGYQVEIPDWSRTSFSSFPALSEAGEISFAPETIAQLGYDPSRMWGAGESIDRILNLGDIGVTQIDKFAPEQIANLTGTNLDLKNLDDLKLMNWQSVQSLTKAIPGLNDLPVKEIAPFADLFAQVQGGNVLGAATTVGQMLNIAPGLGKLPLGDKLNLSKYGLDSIPGAKLTELGKFQDWQKSLIGEVPGLKDLPLGDFPLGLGRPVAIQIALLSQVHSEYEYGDPNLNDTYFVSGETSKTSTKPVACPAGSPCAYLELGDPAGSEGLYYGKRWVSGESQQVNGGYGVLKSLNGGKQPTGRTVYTDLFQVSMILPSEPDGSATLALNFPVCIPQLNSCSPKFIGPIPFLPVKENGPIVMFGGTPPVVNIPMNFQGEINQIMAQFGNILPNSGFFTPCTGEDCPTAEEIQQAIVEALERKGNFLTGWGHSPDATQGGTKACMFAVNSVLADAGVQPLGNGTLSVLEARQDLINGRGQLLRQSQATAGDLVLVDAGGSRQHIGICLNNGCTQVKSNSSSRASFSWISNPSFSYPGSPYNGAKRQEFWRVTN